MSGKNKHIQEIEKKYLKELPSFKTGDTIVVQVKVREGNRERLQAFEAAINDQPLTGIDKEFIESGSIET